VFSDDLEFKEYISFYAKKHTDEQYEQTIRYRFNNKADKKAHRTAMKTVERVTTFNKIRHDIVEAFKKKVNETPQCRVLKIIKAIDTSLKMDIKNTEGTKTCEISGQPIAYARKLTIHPSPEDAPPTFTKPLVFYVRSDFVRVLVSYRTLSRFRYTVIKMIDIWLKNNQYGDIMTDNTYLQYMYDVWMDARKRILHLTYGDNCSFFV